jgi:hypothetical protein
MQGIVIKVYICNMKISIYDPNKLKKQYRLSVHKTGKVGFPSDAALKLSLANNKSADFGQNEEDETDANLYLIIYNDKDKGGFKINKNGAYYSINAKILFDNLELDYQNGALWFEMEEIKIGEQIVYKLEKRTRKLKNKEE